MSGQASGQASPDQIFVYGQVDLTTMRGEEFNGEHSRICLYDENVELDTLFHLVGFDGNPACTILDSSGGFGFGILNDDPNDNTTIDPVIVLQTENDYVIVMKRDSQPYQYVSENGYENIPSGIPFNFGDVTLVENDISSKEDVENFGISYVALHDITSWRESSILPIKGR